MGGCRDYGEERHLMQDPIDIQKSSWNRFGHFEILNFDPGKIPMSGLFRITEIKVNIPLLSLIVVINLLNSSRDEPARHGRSDEKIARE